MSRNKIKDLKKIITRKEKQINTLLNLGLPLNDLILELYQDCIIAQKEILDIRYSTIKKIIKR